MLLCLKFSHHGLFRKTSGVVRAHNLLWKRSFLNSKIYGGFYVLINRSLYWIEINIFLFWYEDKILENIAGDKKDLFFYSSAVEVLHSALPLSLFLAAVSSITVGNAILFLAPSFIVSRSKCCLLLHPSQWRYAMQWVRTWLNISDA